MSRHPIAFAGILDLWRGVVGMALGLMFSSPVEQRPQDFVVIWIGDCGDLAGCINE